MFPRGAMDHKYNDPSVNTNVYLCNYNKEIDKHVFGKGTLRGACSKLLNEHGVIMGYDFSDIIVGRVKYLLSSINFQSMHKLLTTNSLIVLMKCLTFLNTAVL